MSNASIQTDPCTKENGTEVGQGTARMCSVTDPNMSANGVIIKGTKKETTSMEMEMCIPDPSSEVYLTGTVYLTITMEIGLRGVGRTGSGMAPEGIPTSILEKG